MTKMKEFLVRLGKRQMRRLLLFRIIFIVLLFLFEIILFPHQVFNLGVIAVYLLTITSSLADKLSRSSKSFICENKLLHIMLSEFNCTAWIVLFIVRAVLLLLPDMEFGTKAICAIIAILVFVGLTELISKCFSKKLKGATV